MQLYTYRNGVAPTAVNALSEITREVNLAAQVRLQAKDFSKLRELWAATGWSIDTTADQYTAQAVLAGTGVVQAELELAGIGDSTTTIAYVPFLQPVRPRKIDIAPNQQGDVSFNFEQDGDTVATGFNILGVKYDAK